MGELKSTPFEAKHVGLGARMVEFGGWNMPVQYVGILAEHQHTREHVSLFDCSHMGQLRLTGAAVGEALDGILPRRVSGQRLGTCRYNFLLNEQGGVVDDIIVYRIAEEEYYIVVNASTCANDVAYLRSRLAGDVRLADESTNTAKLDVQGPECLSVIRALGLSPETLPGYYCFTQTTVFGVPVLLSRTGYTGELGYELYFDAQHADCLWDALVECPELKPAGLGARDTLRLEVGYPLYGHELNENTTPLAAGFGAMLNLDHVFVGHEALAVTPEKELVGIVLAGRRAARENTIVMDSSGSEIGKVTSGSFAPSIGSAVALAYVKRGTAATGDGVLLAGARQPLEGTVASLPFYTRGTCRNQV